MSSSPEAPKSTDSRSSVEVQAVDLDLVLFSFAGISRFVQEENEGDTNWRHQWGWDVLEAYDRLFAKAHGR